MKLDEQGALTLSEAEVSRQVIDYMHAQHWYCMRLQSGLLQRPGATKSRIRLTEPGTADWCCLRPNYDGSVECMFIEMKRKGGKLSDVQVSWQASMSQRGFHIKVVDDFSAFEKWYRDSFYGDGQRF